MARGGSFAAAGSAVGAALGLVLTLVVTRSLSPTSAGQFFSSTAVFLVLQTLLAFGVGGGLVRFVPRYRALGREADLPALLRAAVLPVVLAGIAGSLGLFAFSATLGEHLGGGNSTDLVHALRLIALVFLPSTLEVAAVECTRAFGSVRKYVLLQQVGVPLLRPILVALAAALHFPLWGIVLMWLLPLFLALGLASAEVRRALRDVLGPTWWSVEPTTSPGSICREYWSFTAARGTAMVMDSLLTWLDVILVASLVSAAHAAVYAAASRFITAGTLVLQALRLTLATDISAALARKDLSRVSEMYRTATQWVIISSWPAYLLMACFAPTVLRIFGPSYVEGATATAILCMAMMVNLAAGNVGTVLLMGGKGGWVLADKTACVVLNIGLNLLLIPQLGISGAAVAWAATILLDSALSFSQVRWGMRVNGDLTGAALAAASALVCFAVTGLVGRIVFGSSLVVLVTTAAAGLVLYVATLRIWRQQLGISAFVAAVRS